MGQMRISNLVVGLLRLWPNVQPNTKIPAKPTPSLLVKQGPDDDSKWLVTMEAKGMSVETAMIVLDSINED